MFSLVFATALGASHTLVRLEQDVSIHHARTSMWTNNGPAPRDEKMTLSVALSVAPSAREKLESTFWAVSNPKKPSYGKYLSKEDLKDLLTVPAERVERVREHFLSNGASAAKASAYNDAITVTMPVAAVERALSTRISAFTHVEQTDFRILRASTSYSVPLALADDVAMVDLLQFPRLPPKSLQQDVNPNSLVENVGAQVGGNWPNACDAAGCKGYVTPAVLGERYKIPINDTSTTMGSMSVAEFQGQYIAEKDLVTFGDACHVDASVSKFIGGNVERAGIEAMLDVECARPNLPSRARASTHASSLDPAAPQDTRAPPCRRAAAPVPAPSPSSPSVRAVPSPYTPPLAPSNAPHSPCRPSPHPGT